MKRKDGVLSIGLSVFAVMALCVLAPAFVVYCLVARPFDA